MPSSRGDQLLLAEVKRSEQFMAFCSSTRTTVCVVEELFPAQFTAFSSLIGEIIRVLEEIILTGDTVADAGELCCKTVGVVEKLFPEQLTAFSSLIGKIL